MFVPALRQRPAGSHGFRMSESTSNPNDASRAEGSPRAEEPRPPRPPGVLVRYGAMNWIGEFSVKASLKLGCGEKLVIQTDRGIELGEPLASQCSRCSKERVPSPGAVQQYVENSGQEFCRSRAGRILRKATAQDLDEQKHLNAHVREDMSFCAERAADLGLDMKVVTAEHLLGGERIVFYFGSPGRVDFRQLVKELASRYRTRIEMRQVGARDEARLVADYEVCGRECCCKNFLKKLRPVNMKMAKLQKSTLDPSKVSGRCGRLRCCLRYENEGYEELAAKLPRINSRVDTEFGPATVLETQVLTQLLMVRTDDDRMMAIPLEEIKAFDLPPAPPRPRPEDRPRRERKAAPPREPRGKPEVQEQSEKASDDQGGRPRRRRSRRRRGAPDQPSTDAGGRREQQGDSATPADGSTGGEQRPPAADGNSGASSERERLPRRRRRRRRRPPSGGPRDDRATPESGASES